MPCPRPTVPRNERMVERPAIQPDPAGIAASPVAPLLPISANRSAGLREPRSTIDARCHRGQGHGPLSLLAAEAAECVRVGVVKAEFRYRHARRLAGFETKGSAVATAMAAAVLGYGIGFLVHG